MGNGGHGAVCLGVHLVQPDSNAYNDPNSYDNSNIHAHFNANSNTHSGADSDPNPETDCDT